MSRPPSFNEFTVREHADSGWEVVQRGMTAGQLCLGEMLETVVKLAVPGTPGSRYPMRPIAPPSKDVLAIGAHDALRNCADYLREECGREEAAEQIEAVAAVLIGLADFARQVADNLVLAGTEYGRKAVALVAQVEGESPQQTDEARYVEGLQR